MKRCASDIKTEQCSLLYAIDIVISFKKPVITVFYVHLIMTIKQKPIVNSQRIEI